MKWNTYKNVLPRPLSQPCAAGRIKCVALRNDITYILRDIKKKCESHYIADPQNEQVEWHLVSCNEMCYLDDVRGIMLCNVSIFNLLFVIFFCYVIYIDDYVYVILTEKKTET